MVGLKAVSHSNFIVTQGEKFYFIAELRNLGNVDVSNNVVVSAANVTTLDLLGSHTIQGGVSTLNRSKFLPYEVQSDGLAAGVYWLQVKHDQADDDPSNDAYSFPIAVILPTPTPTDSHRYVYSDGDQNTDADACQHAGSRFCGYRGYPLEGFFPGSRSGKQ